MPMIRAAAGPASRCDFGFDGGASAADWTEQDLAAAAALRDRALAGTSAYEHVSFAHDRGRAAVRGFHG